MMNNLETLEEAKKKFVDLPQPNSGWYLSYGFHTMSDRRPIIAASNLGRWFMYVSKAQTFGDVCTFLANHYKTGVEPVDYKLKDYLLACWKEKHNKIERDSDTKLENLLKSHYHQCIKKGEVDYFALYKVESL